jgi:hypothetical protein
MPVHRSSAKSSANALALGLLAAAALQAQPTVAPTREPVGPPEGDSIGGYDVTQAFELGYRARTVQGNEAKYASDVNFGNGIRLLSGSISVHSQEGRGRLFDEVVLSTQGLGNDPYQFATLRIQHNRFYRYNLLWRQNDYRNPGLIAPSGGHPRNTRRIWQDHEITLLPHSAVQLFGGIGQNTQTGPSLSSIQLFDSRGDEFPVFTNIDRRQREYRIGAQANLSRFRFLLMRGWQRYEEGSSSRNSVPAPGANANDVQILDRFTRQEPYRGETPFWRANLFADAGSWLAVQGRFSYAGGRRDFTLDESAFGTDRFSNARNRQVLVTGTGSRPVTTASFTVSLFPSSRVTLTNQTAFHQIRMNGDSGFTQLDNATQSLQLVNFEFLGIRTWVNTTEAQLRATRWLTVYGGYRASQRRIRSDQAFQFGNSTGRRSGEQDNTVHSSLAGLRLKPAQPLTITLDSEIARADRPFTPVAERNFHALGVRVQYSTPTLSLSAFSRVQYNTNSVSLSVHGARSRNYAVNGTWTPAEWFALDAGYGKIHLDTATGIVYFAAGELTPGSSIYISNVHTGHLTARLSLLGRADLYVGYSRVQDTGDGQSRAIAPVEAPPADAALRFWQVFPLAFESPQARLSIPITSRIRWNLGYQYYRYGEEFQASRNYRAHTGYSSVLWSF